MDKLRHDTTPQSSEAFSKYKAETDKARHYALNARADNTKLAYSKDWSHFETWCGERDLSPMPASADTVCLYIADCADHYKVSTLERKLTSISQAHKKAGHESPALVSREPLHSIWGGIVRSKSRRRNKVAPALTDDVIAMVAHMEKSDGTDIFTLRSKRDTAIILIGFSGALRRSELCNLIREDLHITSDGMKMTLRKSKTDQEGKGHIIGIRYGSSPLTCPITAILSWLKASNIRTGPVFRRIDKANNVGDKPLTGQAIAQIIKKACLRAGLPPDMYSGHSLRAGFATQAAKAGQHERVIMKHTRHKSEKMVREYIRDGELFNDNPTDALGL